MLSLRPTRIGPMTTLRTFSLSSWQRIRWRASAVTGGARSPAWMAIIRLKSGDVTSRGSKRPLPWMT